MTEARVRIVERNPQDESLGHDKKPNLVIAQASIYEREPQETLLENAYGDGKHFIARHGEDPREPVQLYTFPEREPVLNSRTYPGETAILVKDNPETHQESLRQIEIEHEGFPRTIYTKVSLK